MKTTLFTVASTVLLSSAVFAGGGSKTADHHMSKRHDAQQSTQQQSFNQHDKDQDGKISREEAASNTHLSERWVEIDANQDGSVDVTEFSKFEPVSQTQDSKAEAQTSSGESVMPNENAAEADEIEDPGVDLGADQ